MTTDKIIKGEVVDGKKLGRQLGFPTANIVLSDLVGVAHGVYLVKIELDDDCYYGVANIGMRPTINSVVKPIAEVHIFDFSDDIYGENISIELLEFIRFEQKFNSIEELTANIKNDINSAYKLLNNII